MNRGFHPIFHIFKNQLLLIVVIFLFVFYFDQMTKRAVRQNMHLGETRPVWEEVVGQTLKITYVENPGIAFGIRVGNGSLFTVFSIIASIGVVAYLIIHWREGMGIKGSLALILGGACGNLIDRIRYKQVVDFIDVGINNNLRWPVFNVADSAVVVGMFILFYTVIIAGKRKERLGKSE